MVIRRVEILMKMSRKNITKAINTDIIPRCFRCAIRYAGPPKTPLKKCLLLQALASMSVR